MGTSERIKIRDEHFMRGALQMAEFAQTAGEVPVGAVLVSGDQIIASGFNQSISTCDPTAHAEVVAIRSAAKKLSNYRLVDCDLYVTIEPCAMCVGAIVHARVRRVIFGALEPRAGALQSHLRLLENTHFNHSVDWYGGVLHDKCSNLMKEFFAARRKPKE